MHLFVKVFNIIFFSLEQPKQTSKFEQDLQF